MQELFSRHKFMGIGSIIFGVISFLFPFCPQVKNKLLLQASDVFFIKNILFISFINIGLYLVVFGCFIYSGTLVPYYSANKYEKAKHHLVGLILMFPLLISWSVLIFSKYYVVKAWLKAVWPLLMIYAIYTLFSSIKLVKTSSDTHLKP